MPSRTQEARFLAAVDDGTVMGDEVTTQQKAWGAPTDGAGNPHAGSWLLGRNSRRSFGRFTRLRQSATKDWADSYLAAVTTVGRLTLVTFNKGLRAKARSWVLLG